MYYRRHDKIDKIKFGRALDPKL